MGDTGTDSLRAILVEQVDRLLADGSGPDQLRAAERGEWPEALWAEVEALGLPLALAPDGMGGAGLGWDDAAAVWAVLGRHAAPVPLGESMAAAELEEGRSPIARLPLDRAEPGAPVASAPMPGALGPDAALLAGALLHAALIAGALEAVLDMTVDYANTRKQFGRPIGGFQAVQQLLAQAAGEVAAAGVAAAHAGRAAARRGISGAVFEIASAKVVAGEAAGRVAAVAHQVHAAMGFTDEHPLHLFTRRLWSWRDACGAERVWARRIGEAALARGGAALWPDLTAREEGPAG